MKKVILVLAVLSIVLSGCREETDLYFYTNQKWRVEAALTVDRAIMDLVLGAGGMALGSELGVPVPDSLLQSDQWIDLSLDWMVAEYRNQGLEANWRQRSNTYTLIVKGDHFLELPGVSQGLVTLKQVTGSDDQYHLQVQAMDLGEMDQDLSAFGLGYDRVMTLHAGEIIQSNADEMRGGRAIWRNPGLVDAVFVPASPFPGQIALSLLCAGSVLVTLTLSIRRLGGTTKCPTCGRKVGKGQESAPIVVDIL